MPVRLRNGDCGDDDLARRRDAVDVVERGHDRAYELVEPLLGSIRSHDEHGVLLLVYQRGIWIDRDDGAHLANHRGRYHDA
jgi:hypothetical protein